MSVVRTVRLATEPRASMPVAERIVDRGYRGRKFVDGTEVLVPGRAPRGQSRAKSTVMRQRFHRRAAIELLSRSLVISNTTFGSCAASLKASKATNSFSCWQRRHGTSANGCGWSCFFGFASSARSQPKTSASPFRESSEIFSGLTNYPSRKKEACIRAFGASPGVSPFNYWKKTARPAVIWAQGRRR